MEKNTPSISMAQKVTVACIGTALIASIATWGLTTLAFENSQVNDKNSTVENTIEATSSNIYSKLGTVPGSWVDFNASESEGKAFDSKFVSSVDGQCTYTVNVEKMKPTVTGADGKFLSMNKVLQTIAGRDAGNAEFSTKNVKTSNGEIPFTQLTSTSEFDKGKGKTQESKTAYLHYTFTEVPLADNEYPAVGIIYTCQDSAKWSTDELQGLLDITELNINGQKFVEATK